MKCDEPHWLRNGDGFMTLTIQRITAWGYGVYCWSIFVLLVLSCGGLALLLNNPHQARRLLCFGARTLFRLVKWPIGVTGLENLPPEPHILLVNHTSFLDAIVLTALLPPVPGYAFTVRQQLPIQRLFCPLLRSLGTIVFMGHRHRRDRRNVNVMASALRKGERLVVFPEGMFSRKEGLNPFHAGAFVAAQRAKVPIVVAGLCGARAALPLGTWLPRRTKITLNIGRVLHAESANAADLARLRQSAREEVALLSDETLLQGANTGNLIDPSTCMEASYVN